MKISIVTPVYNDHRVARALDSILGQQQSEDLQLIVIDGGSTDGTLDVLKPYRSRLDVLISEPDGGLYEAMNKGISRATGDIVGILNADDYYYGPNVLQRVARSFSDPQIEACYGDLVYVNGAGKVVRYWKSGTCRPIKFYLGWVPPHPTFFARRNVYQKYGGFDTTLTVSADYELILRLVLRHRIRLTYIPECLVKMTIGGNSNRSVKNIIEGNKQALRSWRRNGLHFGYLVPLLKPAQKISQFVLRPGERRTVD